MLIVGAGGLGVPAAMRLADGAVARITIVDPEAVEISNLPRQIAYHESEIGRPKAELLAARLRALRPGLNAVGIPQRVTAGNAAAMVAEHDFVIDATDDPATKFLINDRCVAAGRAFAYGGVLGLAGQAMTVLGGRSPCLRCLFEEPPEIADAASCRDAGILGPVTGFIGTVQAEEALRFITGKALALAGRILSYDLAAGRTRIIAVAPRIGCGCGSAEHRPGAQAG